MAKFICAWCKEPFEPIVGNAVPVTPENSHGICPACVEKHFPDLYEQWKAAMRRQQDANNWGQ